MKTRFFIFIVSLIFVAIAGYGMTFIARGYRFDTKNINFRPTGLLVITSSPDGAEIIINGQLESATNATITLPPDTYDVLVRKDGFLPWQKRLTLKKEEVTKVDVALFPAAPSLSAITFTGAMNPVLSPDGSKIVYGIAPGENIETEKVGLWMLDLGSLPIGFSSSPKQISNLNPLDAQWYWSYDSRQLLFASSTATFLINTSSFVSDKELTNIRGAQLDKLIIGWKEDKEKKTQSVISNLPNEVKDTLTRKSRAFTISPDEEKIMYVASGSATLADGLIPQIPGSSTQQQDRTIKPNNTYIYDIKEDRNFLVYDKEVLLGDERTTPATSSAVIAVSIPANTKAIPSPTPTTNTIKPTIAWMPNSNHVILAEENKVTIMDYDGTNRQVVWSGPYELPYAYIFPNSNRLLLLTKLGAGSANTANLYGLSLK